MIGGLPLEGVLGQWTQPTSSFVGMKWVSSTATNNSIVPYPTKATAMSPRITQIQPKAMSVMKTPTTDGVHIFIWNVWTFRYILVNEHALVP